MGTPVLFIHGLWLHASSGEPWVETFREAGYDPQAPGWPGDGATVGDSRRDPDAIADHGIDDVVAHFAGIVETLPEAPILVGHSFGGLIAQKLLGQGRARAAVAIDAAQIKGVLPVPLSALRATLPVFRNPLNRHRSVSLTAEQFRYAFGNAVPEEESDRLHEQWTIPAPGRPLFEAASSNFDPHSPAKVDTANEDRGPLLLIASGKDHTVPESVTRSTLRQYRHSSAVTDIETFPDRGHSLVVDSGWPAVADLCLTWLKEHQP